MKTLKNLNFVEKFKYVLIIALVVIVAGVVFGVVRVANGSSFLNFGIDFTGGATIEITSDDQFTTEAKESVMNYVTEQGYKINGDMQETSASTGYIYELRLSYEYNGSAVTDDEAFFNQISDSSVDTDLCDTLLTYLQEDLALAVEDDGVRAYTVGATASSSLINSAIWAIVVAIIVMLIYIVIRFTFSSALAAVCALAHDVLIMFALMSIFNITINSTFIAAVITIIGYSINATIVIFDRVRAELKLSTDREDAEIANTSIKKTFIVNLLSTLTTLIMVVLLVIFSVSTIQEFILPIIFGLVAGLISSLLLAPALWVKFRKVGKKIKDNRNSKKSGYKGAVKQDS